MFRATATESEGQPGVFDFVSEAGAKFVISDSKEEKVKQASVEAEANRVAMVTGKLLGASVMLAGRVAVTN